ncbi:MAG: hypothetical protein ACOYOA_07065 [Saprospiraceae bacterium]
MKVRFFLVLLSVFTILFNAEAQRCKRSRSISAREASVLRHEKKHLAVNRSIAMADGRITPKERRILSMQKRKLRSRAIRMHNH